MEYLEKWNICIYHLHFVTCLNHQSIVIMNKLIIEQKIQLLDTTYELIKTHVSNFMFVVSNDYL